VRIKSVETVLDLN